MARRVVITGMGTVTPLGLNVKESWQNAVEGKSGIGTITHFDTTLFVTKIAGEVKNFDSEKYFEKKEIRRLDPYTQYAIVSAREAIRNAGLSFEGLDRSTIGVIVGSGIGANTNECALAMLIPSSAVAQAIGMSETIPRKCPLPLLEK